MQRDADAETDARLDQIFGDGWTHTLKLESVAPLPSPATTEGRGGAGASSAAYPLRCLAGRRACPPEDVGGAGGHEEVAEWVRAGEDPGFEFSNGLTPEEMRGWLPAGWDPDHFDVNEADAALVWIAPRER